MYKNIVKNVGKGKENVEKKLLHLFTRENFENYSSVNFT